MPVPRAAKSERRPPRKAAATKAGGRGEPLRYKDFLGYLTVADGDWEAGCVNILDG